MIICNTDVLGMLLLYTFLAIVSKWLLRLTLMMENIEGVPCSQFISQTNFVIFDNYVCVGCQFL